MEAEPVQHRNRLVGVMRRDGHVDVEHRSQARVDAMRIDERRALAQQRLQPGVGERGDDRRHTPSEHLRAQPREAGDVANLAPEPIVARRAIGSQREQRQQLQRAEVEPVEIDPCRPLPVGLGRLLRVRQQRRTQQEILLGPWPHPRGAAHARPSCRARRIAARALARYSACTSARATIDRFSPWIRRS